MYVYILTTWRTKELKECFNEMQSNVIKKFLFQTKLRVMVEENAATGARLDGELERARGECASLRGELRTVRGALVLNNNHQNNGASSNGSNLSGTSTNSTSTSASSTTTSNNLSAPPSQDSTESMGHNSQEEPSKRLSANSSPVDKRSSASEKSVSPIDKGNSPIDKKDRASPIDRSKTSPSVG